jgi:tetratricopeptide (TPR) repeat protein
MFLLDFRTVSTVWSFALFYSCFFIYVSLSFSFYFVLFFRFFFHFIFFYFRNFKLQLECLCFQSMQMESETMETSMGKNVTEDVTDLEITPGLEGLNMLEITPGLIGLNLNILHVLDMHMREEAKWTILKSIDREHLAVSNVQKNMAALLKSRIPKERHEGREDLENIVRGYPNHLNSLADLEHMYLELNRISDANRCRCTIDRILKSNRFDDIQNKRVCLFEQGYAILTERTLINENTVEMRISDLQNILKTEHDVSNITKRRECLERALHHQVQVLRNVQNANKDETADGHLARKDSSLQKFKEAVSLSNNPLPHPVWNFYFAKALNQYYDSLEVISKYNDKMKGEMRTVTLEAITKFWEITHESHGSDMKIFVARSYAYIGHILMKRAYLVRAAGNQFTTGHHQSTTGADHQLTTGPSHQVTACHQFALLKNAEFMKYMEDPLACVKLGYKMAPNDISVLNRYGRSLWNRSYQTKDVEEKLVYLRKADDILTTSIQIDSDRNWFAYSSRMIVKLDLADTIPDDQESGYLYLTDAKEDGNICFKSKTTRRDMSVLATACQKLAKFPRTQEFGPQCVHTKDLLYQALDYLFYAAHLGDPPDFHWTNRIASCLFDLGEYEQAIEWQRKAWFLSAPAIADPFVILCIFMLTMFEDGELWGKPSTDHLYREMLYIIIYARQKYKDIANNIENICKQKTKEVLKLLNDILIVRSLPLRPDEKDIINYCLGIFMDVSSSDMQCKCEFQKLHDRLADIQPEEDTEYVLSDIFRNTSLKPLAESVKPWSKDYKYDFFVSHSHRDGNWVDNILLRHLESKFDENDVAFKGIVKLYFTHFLKSFLFIEFKFLMHSQHHIR